MASYINYLVNDNAAGTHRGGICIWSASFPGNAASVRSGVTAGTIPGSSGIRWTLVDFLRVHADEQVTALSWSPDGRYPY